MIGAIIGDVIGSPYEWNNFKNESFEILSVDSIFTDDTVMTIATAVHLLVGVGYAKAYRGLGLRYLDAGYGAGFLDWLKDKDKGPYQSWGNGSAMRVAPVGWAFNTIEEVLAEAKKSAEVTHDHPEGIKGAQATALAIFMGRKGSSKDEIRKKISEDFSYDLNRTCDTIRPTYKFDVSCQGSVPEAIIAFLDSNSFEDAIRKAVSLGGDSDTIACITGGIAEAFYKDIPKDIARETLNRLPKSFLRVISKFYDKYPKGAAFWKE